jgi:type II secretory pathway component GspD/PulD (secretin)
MNKNMQILIITMIAAVCSAQTPFSEEQGKKELQAAKPEQPAVQKPAEPVVSTAEVVKVEPVTAEIVQAPMTEAQTKELVDVSISNYAGGKYTPARNGFERVLLAHPDNAVSRYFLNAINQAERRNNEETAIKKIDQAWGGMILRDYAIADDMTTTLKLVGKTQNEDVKHLFSTVPFPEGACATYWPKLNKIIVLNTPSNLKKVETIMSALEGSAGQKEGQIEIKARFVEFSEGALEELGFKWNNIRDAKTAGDAKIADDWSVKANENLFSDSLRGSGDVFPQPQSIGASTGGGTIPATGDWTANRLTDNFNADAGELTLMGDIGPNVDVLIRALDQTSGTDILSAPSVVTRAGQKASIQVGQTHYFPDTFDFGGSEGTIINVDYQGFTEKLMGVDLSVTPKLVKDNLIEMDLNPKVTDLLGWRQYQIAPANSAYTYFQNRVGMTYQHDAIVASLPIFRRREVKAKVSIQDGSTITMGGLISEKTESFSDRVPVLGSIPLVGRLFRTEGERKVKRNLMIFITASKVSPNGRIISDRSFEK